MKSVEMWSTEQNCNMREKDKKFHICWVTTGGFKALQCKQTQTNLSFLSATSSKARQSCHQIQSDFKVLTYSCVFPRVIS